MVDGVGLEPGRCACSTAIDQCSVVTNLAGHSVETERAVGKWTEGLQWRKANGGGLCKPKAEVRATYKA